MTNQYSETLNQAVQNAIANIYEPDAAPYHVSAQKREYHDGSTTWVVFIGDKFADFATDITNDFDPKKTAAAELAALIDGCWDEDWTDLRAERPAGDESHGSSDWAQRG